MSQSYTITERHVKSNAEVRAEGPGGEAGCDPSTNSGSHVGPPRGGGAGTNDRGGDRPACRGRAPHRRHALPERNRAVRCVWTTLDGQASTTRSICLTRNRQSGRASARGPGTALPLYRQNARTIENLQRDRLVMPAFDAVMRIRMDQQFANLTDALASRYTPQGRRAKAMRAAVALALDFWTWRRLAGERMSDEAAAALMTGAVKAAAHD